VRALFLTLAIAAISFFPLPTTLAAEAAPASLKTFLQREGYGGSVLRRRFGNHLFATAVINGRSTALAIDTGAPFTLIDSASARAIGLAVRETKGTITGMTGLTERAGVAKIGTLRMGNCTFLNVPIGVADASSLNSIRGPHLDGLFGVHEMSKFGVVVDCARQMLYVNPRGPSPAANQNLERFLAGRGFSRIPMQLDFNHHLEIQARVNGHPVAMIVDTGAASTFVPAPIASAAGVVTTGLNYKIGGTTGGALPGKIVRVQDLALGDLVIHNAELIIGESKLEGSGLLAEDYLSWNFGIVDVGGLNLYLRPPDSTAAKKR
jgi:predicted aspartyl protease